MDQPSSPFPQPETNQTSANPAGDAGSSQTAKGCSCGCGTGNCTCGAKAASNVPATSAYVYALGRIEPRFPSLSIEKEFAQATGRAETIDLTDHEALQAVLSDKQNRYLVRQLCWVLNVDGVATYLVLPREETDLDLLIGSLRPRPRPTDVDVIVGVRGPARACNELILPTVVVDQLYSFDLDTLVTSIQTADQTATQNIAAAAESLFMRVLRLSGNAGEIDEHRALNYLAIRYPAIYTMTAEAHGRNLSFVGFKARSSQRDAVRKIAEVIFSYRNRQTDIIEKYFVRVDVTEEFPFLVTKLSPFYEM